MLSSSNRWTYDGLFNLKPVARPLHLCLLLSLSFYPPFSPPPPPTSNDLFLQISFCSALKPWVIDICWDFPPPLFRSFIDENDGVQVQRRRVSEPAGDACGALGPGRDPSSRVLCNHAAERRRKPPIGSGHYIHTFRLPTSTAARLSAGDRANLCARAAQPPWRG